jgi:hypothetical protein
MAHGSPRINVCYNCNHYTLVERFSKDPLCPSCGKVSQQADEEELVRRFNLSGFYYKFMLSFGKWVKIEKTRVKKLGY